MKKPTAAGKTGVKNLFTLAEHESLSGEEQSAIQKVLTFLLEHEISTAEAPVNNETLSRLCDIFGPRPKPPGGSSELRHIVQSFYLSAAMLAEAKLRDDGWRFRRCRSVIPI